MAQRTPRRVALQRLQPLDAAYQNSGLGAAQQLVPQEEHAELLSELPTRVKDRLKK